MAPAGQREQIFNHRKSSVQYVGPLEAPSSGSREPQQQVELGPHYIESRPSVLVGRSCRLTTDLAAWKRADWLTSLRFARLRLPCAAACDSLSLPLREA